VDSTQCSRAHRRPTFLRLIFVRHKSEPDAKPGTWPAILFSNAMKTLTRFAAGALLLGTLAAHAQTARISVAVDQPGHPVSPALWGIFFEDINLSADGGIYPELVRNRSFEDAETPESWKF